MQVIIWGQIFWDLIIARYVERRVFVGCKIFLIYDVVLEKFYPCRGM